MPQMNTEHDVPERLSWRIDSFAKAGDFSQSFVRKAIREGRLRAVKIGRAVVIPHTEALRFINGEAA